MKEITPNKKCLESNPECAKGLFSIKIHLKNLLDSIFDILFVRLGRVRLCFVYNYPITKWIGTAVVE